MVCILTPFFSGVMHIRAPVPARSSSRRQQPIHGARRASTCVVDSGGAGCCANALEAVSVNARRVCFMIVSLESEVNARAEPEAAEIDRLEVEKVLAQVRVRPGILAFE